MGVVGYLAAAITAFYAFRMVFRVFFRAPVPEARELEAGHPHHGEPHNPATGEPEDKHVGFDGTEHHNAETSWPMKLAMAPLALGAVVAGYVAIPGVTDTLEHFLEPTFADSRFIDDKPTDAAEYADLGIGSIMAFLGIALAALVYLRRRDLRLVVRERCSAVHTFLFRKWYFDEVYDAAVVRPMAAFGRFGRTVIETRFVQGTIVGGAVGLVRAGSSVARSVQSGYLRGYAALLVVGVSGARPLLPDHGGRADGHLPPVDPGLPAAGGGAGRAPSCPPGSARWVVTARHGGGAGDRGLDDRRLRQGVRRPALRDRRRLDLRAGDPLLARGGRAEPVPAVPDRGGLGVRRGVVGACARPSGCACTSSTWRWPRPPCSAPSPPRTWRCS